MPVFNAYEYTKQCIHSMLENTHVSCKVIIIDNGSTDETATWSYPKIRNKENLGFSKAVNQGIKIAKGDYICLLNNDTVVTSYWLTRLEWHLKNSNVDIISPCTNKISGKQQVNPGIYNDISELYNVSEEFYLNHKQKCEISDYVIGFCMLIKNEVFEQIGLFDEFFDLGGEEIDFCIRAKIAGFKIGIAKDVFIHHFGSITFLNIGDIDYYNDICRKNVEQLKKKWGDKVNFP